MTSVAELADQIVTPKARFLHTLAGAMSLSLPTVQFGWKKPSNSSFVGAEIDDRFAGAFGFTAGDIDERKAMINEHLFPLITHEGSVPQYFIWARSVSAMRAVNRLDKMAKLVVKAARFESAESLRGPISSEWATADLQTRASWFEHTVRRGLVVAMMQETQSSCAKFTLAGVLSRACFAQEGKKAPISVMRGALEQLQEQNLAWAVVFTDEKKEQPTKNGRRELRTLLLWRLQYVLQQRVRVTVLPVDLLTWERDYKITRSRNGWVDSPAGLVEAINDLAVFAAEVATQKDKALAEEQEEEEEEEDDEGDSGPDWGEDMSSSKVEFEESDSAGSDMELETGSYGAGMRKRKSGATTSTLGRGNTTVSKAKRARLLEATALPTVNELMKNHTLVKKLVGRQLMMIKNGEPMVAVGQKTRVLHGRPEMFMETPFGGEWMDGVTALTNIMALEVAERHPMLGNTKSRPQQEMQNYESDSPRSLMKSTDSDVLDRILSKRDVAALSASGHRARKTFDLLGGEHGFSSGMEVREFLRVVSKEVGLNRLNDTVHLFQKAEEVVVEVRKLCHRSVTVKTVFQIAFFSTALPDLTSLLVQNKKVEKSLLSNNQARTTASLR